MNPTETEKTPEQLDVEYLQSELEGIHPNLYRNVSKETLTESLVNATEVEPEFFKLAVQESLALTGDMHTCVSEIVDRKDYITTCKEIEGKYYIIGALEAYSSLIGEEILAINGHGLNEIISKISQLSSKENIEVLLNDFGWYLTSNQVLKYYGFSHGDTVKITTPNGDAEIILDEESNIKKTNPLRWRKEEREDPTYFGNKDYHFRVVGDTLLLQYNETKSEGYPEEELREIKKRFLETANTVKSIVVDLRQASGGCSIAMRNLFADLQSDNKIYVAMGRKTLSSGMHNLFYLKLQRNATLIGENAGQKPNRFGHIERIELPNSHMRIQCSKKYWELWPGHDIDLLEPDIKIPVTIEDYKNNTDPLNKWIKDNL